MVSFLSSSSRGSYNIKLYIGASDVRYILLLLCVRMRVDAHIMRHLVTIAADIMANLPSNTLFGLVSMAGLPYMEMLPDVASKTTLQYAGAMTNKENFRGAVEACMSVADLPFAKPEEVPFDIRCAWLGTILLPSVAVRGNYFSRTQDPTKLVEAAGQGLPLCVISGTADQVVYPKVALEELQRRFTDITLYEIEGAGHAVFYDAAEEVVDHVVSFARRIGFTVRDILTFLIILGINTHCVS